MSAVRIKILMGGLASRIVQVDDVSREIKEFQICDRTGQTQLTLWEDKIPQVKFGGSYEISHVITRKFNEKIVIRSTFSTTIKEIDDVGEPDVLQPYEGSQELLRICGCVTSLSVEARHHCRRCKATQTNYKTECKRHCCEGCGWYQIPSLYTVVYSGHAVVESEGHEHKLNLTNSAVYTFVSEGMGGSVSDTKKIVNKLMGARVVQFEVGPNQIVMSIKVIEEKVVDCEPE